VTFLYFLLYKFYRTKLGFVKFPSYITSKYPTLFHYHCETRGCFRKEPCPSIEMPLQGAWELGDGHNIVTQGGEINRGLQKMSYLAAPRHW